MERNVEEPFASHTLRPDGPGPGRGCGVCVGGLLVSCVRLCVVCRLSACVLALSVCPGLGVVMWGRVGLSWFNLVYCGGPATNFTS